MRQKSAISIAFSKKRKQATQQKQPLYYEIQTLNTTHATIKTNHFNYKNQLKNKRNNKYETSNSIQ